MISIHCFTRNFRRAASLRAFSNATVSTKTDPADVKKAETSDTDKKTHQRSSEKLFSTIRTINEEPSQQLIKTTTTTTATTTIKAKPKSESKRPNDLSTQISNAISVTKLLTLSEQQMTKNDAMLILTKISTLTAENKAKVSEFENDYRFLKICRILSTVPLPKKSKAMNVVSNSKQKSAELEMVLSVAGDDEASQIIQTLSLTQKVKVFSSLARKKTRSIVVLKSLASAISSDTGKMNLKECSDLLFAMTSLNFIDDMLLCRIATDINDELTKQSDKTAVIGSIVTSLGFIKYKEPTLLNNLSKAVVEKHALFRPKDLASLILTLALVNYRPQNIADLTSKLIPKITQHDLLASEWLDYVWALCVLELFQSSHLESVFRPTFFENFPAAEFSPAQKMKLSNINAVAKNFATNYDGPFLDSESPVNNYLCGYRKSKKVLVQGLLDTLKNLFTSTSYIRTEHDTKFGFIIDAECVLSENRTPLAIESTEKNASRVAFMVLDYHDVCKGSNNEPNGIHALAIKLLQKNGYKVLLVPYNEFTTSDKVLKRVQYLDSKLKHIVKQSSK